MPALDSLRSTSCVGCPATLALPALPLHDAVIGTVRENVAACRSLPYRACKGETLLPLIGFDRKWLGMQVLDKEARDKADQEKKFPNFEAGDLLELTLV